METATKKSKLFDTVEQAKANVKDGYSVKVVTGNGANSVENLFAPRGALFALVHPFTFKLANEFISAPVSKCVRRYFGGYKVRRVVRMFCDTVTEWQRVNAKRQNALLGFLTGMAVNACKRYFSQRVVIDALQYMHELTRTGGAKMRLCRAVSGYGLRRVVIINKKTNEKRVQYKATDERKDLLKSVLHDTFNNDIVNSLYLFMCDNGYCENINGVAFLSPSIRKTGGYFVSYDTHKKIAYIRKFTGFSHCSDFLRDYLTNEFFRRGETVAKNENVFDILKTAYGVRQKFDKETRQLFHAVCRGLSVLSEREKEIFCLIARGKSQRDIAKLLNISRGNVQTYCARMRAKIQGFAVYGRFLERITELKYL